MVVQCAMVSVNQKQSDVREADDAGTQTKATTQSVSLRLH